MSKAFPIVAALAVVFVLVAGCDNDLEDPGVYDHPPVLVGVEGFLDTRCRVYSQMDSVAYAACLDSSYEFVPLAKHIPADWPFESPWDRTFDLRIAGDMFNARYNPDGQRVTRIQLVMTVRSIADSSAGGDSLLAVLALVDLLVVVEDPTSDEGIINYVCNGDQIFLIRYAPSAPSDWLIVRQIDRMPINKAVPWFGTVESSWTMIKVLFSGYMPPQEG